MYSKLSKKRDVYRFWKIQWLFLVVITILALLFSKTMAWSAFFGGLTFLLPFGFFMWKGFRHAGALQAKQIFWDFCIGHVGKLLLTGFLFLLAFTVVHPALAPYLLGFFLMQSTPWLMAWFNNRGRA